MKRSILAHVALACGLAAFCVIAVGVGQVEALPKKKDTEPKPPPKPPTPPKPPEPGSYNGPFNGNMTIVAMVPKSSPTLAKATSVTPQVVNDKLNIKDLLEIIWNGKRIEAQARLKAELAKQKGIYNVNVKLARAAETSRLLLSVSPKAKTLGLRFTVPGHVVTARADVFGPNPTVRAKFDLELDLRFETSGPPANPLVLKSAKVIVRNPDVDIDSNIIGDALRGISEFFRGHTFGNDVERAINGKSVNLTGEVAKVMGSMNNILRPFTLDRGLRVVTPSFEGGRLFLRLSQPLPVLTPAANSVR